MATIAWESYVGAPAWTDMSTNRLVFSGSLTSITTTVQATQFQTGTHLGTGTPGTDACGTNHNPNLTILTSTTVSVNGGASVALSDANIADTQCSFRLHFNDAAAYQNQNGRLYSYNGTTTTTQATGVDLASWVKYQTMTSWFTLNSDTTTGPSIAGMTFTTANVGGNNTSNFQTLANQLTNVADHYYYCGVSASPETAGGKAAFALGAYIEYF